ncbi:molybdopterin-dependent oxidoreductase [Vibrio maerlii]|uniref:molybdopterin-dependent oxidoreductase n=1 Tax=Vibrio maerlii TaxID=2231648 RepID=UPI0030B8D9EE
MTALNSYVKGKDKLDTNIKFLFNYASNIPMNQHSDLNKTQETLKDESLCEFILTWDNHMTASARWSDLVLPDVSWLEVDDLINNSISPYFAIIGQLTRSILQLVTDELTVDVPQAKLYF